MGERLRIGELAERAGVTTRTIRYYESLGLLEPIERDGGYRYFPEETLHRLRKIDALKTLGLSLEEIAGVISLYFEDPTGIKAKKRVLAILQDHLQETEAKIAALEQFRSDLKDNTAKIEENIEEASRSKGPGAATRTQAKA
jgi:MerR family copper efflux transcriptional regulator